MMLNDDTPEKVTATEVPPSPTTSSFRPVASWIHTAVFILILLAFSIIGARAQQRHVRHVGHMLYYSEIIVWEWLLVGYVFLGIRKRGVTLRDLIDGRWRSGWDLLRDIGIAIGFWVVSITVLSLLGHALGLGGAGAETDIKNKLGALIPSTRFELLLFVLVSLTAGFCEEVMFRGYLQRQFAALTKVDSIAIILQAIVFGLGHGYEGYARMIVIGVYGAMFGILVFWRKSLRPGMMSHAMHDALSGFFLYLHFAR